MALGTEIALIKALGGGGGSGGGVLVVGWTVSGELENVYTLDKTWQEIHDADYAVIVEEDLISKGYYQIISVFLNTFSNKYIVKVNIPENEDETLFTADSASDYPSFTFE